MKRRKKERKAATAQLYLSLAVLELSVAIEEAGELDLRYSLGLLHVGQTTSVELTLCLARFLVHLLHDAQDQPQLNGPQRNNRDFSVCFIT